MANITEFTDVNGVKLYPITKVECVYDDNNNNVQDLLNNKVDAAYVSNAIANKCDKGANAVLLYSGSASTGNKTLSQSLNNFTKIYTTIGGDYVTNFTSSVPTTWLKSSTTNGQSQIMWGNNQYVTYRYVNNTTLNIYQSGGINYLIIYGEY